MEQRLSMQRWQHTLQALPWLAPLWAKAPLLLLLFMAIVLAQLAAQLSWRVLAPAAVETGTRVARPAPVAPALDKGLTEVVNAHLFGQAAPSLSQDPINAPATRLKLSLNGVFASDNPKIAMAIIGDSGGEQKHYRIGDAVPGGARVHAIYPDRVILDRLGKLETLNLPRDIAPFDAGGATLAPGEAAVLPTASDTVHQVQASDKVKQLRETLIATPQEVWQDVRIEPVMDSENNVMGYRFAHKDQRLMQSLGLTTEDIIVEINGRPLTDPSVLYAVMSQITTMENVSITIKRNGQTETIEINM
ncbi:MAG: type II secretion system protein GspC [Gammaproteobacteria bacterium]